MKRIVIECFVVLFVLLLCALYGAVTVRDAHQPQFSNETTRTVFHEQKIVVPKSEHESSTDSEELNTNTPTNSGTESHGYSLSDRVQRLFLWGVSAIAEFVDGLIQIFA
ncbi:hypothetical protein [Sporolactobacillus nakayamae]|uniref:Uncharacterized protein n=1 Tax=Sporolactobacillus nakayamae TaxID=269670 RepID=A0A1I2NW88_9BACL|nr:hypothetical protein [Sporolactobacillus nakayamae]SFG08195.1 hypothetical protein SAMN02982927_00597 [Sporolactobacillus nakayamae]